MKAIVLDGTPGKAHLVTDHPLPKLRPGYLLVKVKAVAANPSDWKHMQYWNVKGCLLGIDYAGVVVQTGEGYSRPWSVGDRLCGFAHGANELELEDGAFAETIVVKADIQIHLPSHYSFEEGAAIGAGALTCGQGLFQQMNLELPSTGQPPTRDEIVLVYGGSTASGSLGIQLLKLAGYIPIATCSPHNFGFVKSLQAQAAFDYKSPDCVQDIKGFLHEKPLQYIWDTISTADSAGICAQLIDSGGVCGQLLWDVPFPRNDVKVTFSFGNAATGERMKKGDREFPPSFADFEFMKSWMQLVEQLLEKRLLRPHPIKVGHGLEGVLKGLEQIGNGSVSGQKLVYTL